MNPSFDVDEMERFSKRRDVTSAVAAISEAVAPFNEALSSLTPAYDSMVIFSHAHRELTALPVTHLDAEGIDTTRHTFRDDAILGRRVLLTGTALGETLKNSTATPHYKASKINHLAPQVTYTHPLFSDQQEVGAIQHSFTAPDGEETVDDLPEEAELIFLANKNRQEIARAAEHIARLQLLGKELGSLAIGLELEEPIAPNAYIIRWDITDSSAMARDSRQAALDAYTNQIHLLLKDMTEHYPHDSDTDSAAMYSDQGDGAYIILPINSLNTYSPATLDRYRATTASQFLTDLQRGIATITRQFADIAPRVKINSDFGFVETNGIGRLKSKTMFSLADQKKQ